MASEVFPVLQLYAIKEPLFPNLKTLKLSVLTRELIPCIPLFLSPRTTTIYIAFASLPNIPKVIIVSMISTFPTLCPNLQSIELQFLPRDPMITAALSGMLLTGNLDALRILKVDSPLAEEAHEAIHALTDLHELSVVIEKDPFLLPLVLPNLTRLTIEYDHGSAWLQMFRGATLGRLESVTFHPRSEEIGPFLEAFEKVALATSAHSTLSQFCLKTPYPWDPNYSSLLPFTQLTHLIIEFSCDEGCSSTMDDDIITNLARTMPKLDTLQLGEPPCQEIRTGVTTKGFTALAHYCSDLSALRIHFQVASLCAPPVNYRMVFDAGSTAPRRGCALRSLDVGEVPVPEDSVLMVALNLSLIFPNINSIEYDGENWERVADAVYLSNAIIRCTSKEHHLSTPRTLVIPPQEPHPRAVVNREPVWPTQQRSTFPSTIPCPPPPAQWEL